MSNNLIQIKRSTTTDAPPSLANGELAISFTDSSNSLFVGDPRNVVPGTPLRIAGGKYSFLHQATLAAGGGGGVLSANAVIITNANNFVDQLKTNTLVVGADGTTNASATFVVDGTANVSGNVTIGGNLTLTGGAAIAGNINFDVGTLYIDSVSNRVGINNTAPDASLTVTGTANVSGNTILGGTLVVQDAVRANNTLFVSGAATINNTINVVSTATFGNTVSISGNLAVDSNVLLVDTVNNRVGINDSTPAVALSVGGDAVVSANLTANNLVINADATINGNLVVSGVLTTIDTINLVVEDPLFKIGKNNNVANSAGDSVDLGFYGVYANSTTDMYTGIFRDASDGKYHFFNNLTVEPTTTIDTSDLSYRAATIVAYLESGALSTNTTALAITANSSYSVSIAANSMSLTTALPVTSGGTGQQSFTTAGVIYGNGTGALQVTSAGANGDVLQVINNLPTFGTLDGGLF